MKEKTKSKSSHKVLTQKQLQRLIIPLLKKKGKRYRKVQSVLGRKAKGGENISTITSDGLETKNTARSGDYIVKNKTKAGERYIVKPKVFEKTYEHYKKRKGIYDEYKPNKQILALEIKASFFKKQGYSKELYFVAPWGSKMVLKVNDFLACPLDFSEAYRIAKKEFFETYELV